MNARRRKPYRPKHVRIPMTGLRDMIALHMYTSLGAIERAADVESFDSLAGIMNMVSVAVSNDTRFSHENRLIQGGVAAMNDVARLLDAHVPLQEHHTAPVRVAVETIDRILPHLDVAKLYVSERVAVAAGRELRKESAPAHT